MGQTVNNMKNEPKLKMNKAEWFILAALVGGMGLMGLTAGLNGFLVFVGLGLLIWVVWRGRKMLY